MRRFIVHLNIVMADKKITCIKALRAATGMGLLEAKNFVENPISGYGDSFGGELIVNAEQLANLFMADKNGVDGHFDFNHPTFNISSVKLISEKGIDISGLNPL